MDELYNFRDCYFETHSVEEAGRKENDVAQELEKTLKMLEEKEGRRHLASGKSLICRKSITLKHCGYLHVTFHRSV